MRLGPPWWAEALVFLGFWMFALWLLYAETLVDLRPPQPWWATTIPAL